MLIADVLLTGGTSCREQQKVIQKVRSDFCSQTDMVPLWAFYMDAKMMTITCFLDVLTCLNILGLLVHTCFD